MKLLLAGDVHGEAGWAKVLCRVARDNQCDWIVQLGDFGVWEHRPAGRVFLNSVEELLAHYGQKLVFIPGNHENWPLLRDRYPAHWCEDCNLVPEMGWGKVRENLYWAERGSRWTWDGVSFVAVGGAFSIDKQWRTPGDSWWPEETITDDDVEFAIAGGPVDVLLSHDCPAGVDVFGSHHSEDYLRFPESELNRERLLRIVKAVRPNYVAHGHFHVRNRGYIDLADEVDGDLRWHRVTVDGFGRDGMFADAWAVVNIHSEIGVS